MSGVGLFNLSIGGIVKSHFADFAAPSWLTLRLSLGFGKMQLPCIRKHPDPSYMGRDKLKCASVVDYGFARALD
jgi:hypothetical protein